jgi:IS4 transposase
MRHQNSLLHQILQFIPWHRFDTLVDSHGADVRVRRLSTKSQLIALIYAQLSGAQSLREIEQALAGHGSRLYHLGAARPARSTLADANAKRPAQLFADLFALVAAQASRGLRRATGEAIHLIDASSIRLTDMSRAWADFETKGARVKLHLDFDASRSVPANIAITPARINDVSMTGGMPVEPGETYVFDLGYYDFSWWAQLHRAGCRIVTRLKTHTCPRLIEIRPIARGGPVKSDRIIAIDGRLKSARGARHPLAGIPLREVVVVTQDGRTLRLVTNDLEAPAEEIGQLYKARWLIELFFRWVKQHLKITRFLGTSENAVRIQIAVALIAYILLRLAQEATAATPSLLAFIRHVQTHLMERRRIGQLTHPPPLQQRDPRQWDLALC